MRYESALQIIRFLKSVYGTPVPILRIVQNIELSYQPTHRHVRTLREMDVVEAVKQGREVLCQLRSTEATHVWLSLLAVVDRGRLLALPGAPGELAAAVRRTVTCHGLPGVQAAALHELTPDALPEVILLLAGEEGHEEAVRRCALRCRAVDPNVRMGALTPGELAGRLRDPREQREWVRHMHPLWGEQAFWSAVLPCEASRGRWAAEG